jgi:hypothetical protein
MDAKRFGIKMGKISPQEVEKVKERIRHLIFLISPLSTRLSGAAVAEANL